MANKAPFNIYGITIPTADGEIVLNAGANMTILPQGNFVTFSAQFPVNAVINSQTPWQPPILADTKAPNNSVYYSSTSSKLVYKDASGTTHALY